MFRHCLFIGFLLSYFSINSQSSFRLDLDVKDVEYVEIRNFLTVNTSTTAAGNSMIIGNYSQKNFQNKIFLLQLDQLGNVSKSNSIELANYSLSALVSSVFNNKVYVFLETYNNLSVNYYLAAIDLSTLNIIWTRKIYSASTVENSKLIHSRSHIYLFNLLVNNKGVKYNIVHQIDLAGNVIWSKHYYDQILSKGNFIDAILFNNSKFVLATSKEDSVNPIFTTIHLHLLDQDLYALKSSSFKFYNAANTEINRFGKIELGLNGSRIHLASQEILGRDGHGKITISMIDTNLNLLTWRNYSAEMVLEDFNIIPGRFLIAGQRPVENGEEGYSIASINSSNAIPELLSTYNDGFTNSSIASHSFISSSDSRSLMLVARPNQSNQPYLAIALQRDSASNSCHESFSFKVTKDPLELLERDLLLVDSLGLVQDEKLDNLKISSLGIVRQELCNTSSVINHDVYSFIQYWTSMNQELIISVKDNSTQGDIKIYNLQGIVQNSSALITSNQQTRINIQSLSPGIFCLMINGRSIGRFIKY